MQDDFFVGVGGDVSAPWRVLCEGSGFPDCSEGTTSMVATQRKQ